MHEAPSLKELEEFLNITKTYNVKESYQSLTDHSEMYRNVRVRIQDFAKREQDSPVSQFPPRFNSMEDMEKAVLNFFQTLGPTYYSEIVQVLKDQSIRRHITMVKEGKPSGNTRIDNDNKIISHINVTPDANGFMTLAQELSNLHVLRHSINQENKRDEQEEHLVEKTTNMFMSTMIIEYLAKESNLSPREVDNLQFNALKELYGETNRLESDEEIFQIILDAYPEAFATNLENFTPQNFLDAIDQAQSKMSPGDLEKINYRIKEVAEKGNTARYIQGEVAAEITGLALSNEFHNHPESRDQVLDDLLESIQNTHVLTEVAGMTEEDIIESGTDTLDKASQKIEDIKQQCQEKEDLEDELIRGLELRDEFNPDKRR